MLALFSLLACRYVGGSEGFVVDDIVLLHQSGSEGVQTSGDFQRSYTGRWNLMVLGGGNCRYIPEPEVPEGEGWEESDNDTTTCEGLQQSGMGWDFLGSAYWHVQPESEYSMRVSINDLEDAPTGEAFLVLCGPPDANNGDSTEDGYSVTPVLYETLSMIEVKVSGDYAHVSGSVDDRLSFNWTLPICELE